jgi:Flavin reductase like domain
MGEVCTAVTVVTAMDGNRPHGTTVSAFSSLSLDPPLVARFATRGPDKFDGVAWRSDWRSPRLEGVAGFLDEAQQGHLPLTYHRRAFGTYVPL